MNVFLLPLLVIALNSYPQLKSRYELASPLRSAKTCNQQLSVFQFNTFKEGLIVFRNNSTRKALMNYNFLHGKLQFIDEHRDTLVLTDKYMVKRILIDNQEFVPGVNDEDEDMEIASVYSTVKLAKRTRLVPPANPYSASTQQFKTDPSSSTPSSLFISSRAGEFQWQNTVQLTATQLKTTYYFIDTNGIIHSASLKSIHKLYQKQLADVRAYSKMYRVNYSDIRQVTNFLTYLEGRNQ